MYSYYVYNFRQNYYVFIELQLLVLGATFYWDTV